MKRGAPTAPPSTVDAGVTLWPDAGRVIARFFVPGKEDVGAGDSRAAPVIERLLGLSDAQVTATMDDIGRRFSGRHQSLDDTFERHAELVAHRLDPTCVMSTERRRLLGATFTHEYAVEAAALCNPSIVAHPRQLGADDGETAFVLSVRGIGEGHRSSIGFRTGSVDGTGAITMDRPAPLPRAGLATPGDHYRSVLHRKLAERDDDHENAHYVMDPLPDSFDDVDLRSRIAALRADAATRRNIVTTVLNLQYLVRCSYNVEFPASAEISERVLWPESPAESHGMEDARFVEITDGSAPRYCATYTAFDGTDASQNLLTTEDFSSFTVSPMAGAAARGKGLALFPRMIGGRYAALSRADRETNSLARSDDLRCWDTSHIIQTPLQGWEMLQLGNCGSPIETAEGWLVLTHGVGPMRTYSIGAILLDLDHPEVVLAACEEPILRPGPNQRDGYVPNVVYSCGALAIGDRLVLPYGVGDQSIAIATLSIGDLIGAMRRLRRSARPKRSPQLDPQKPQIPQIPEKSQKEHSVPEKSPQKPSAKKQGKTLKEKRATKREKKSSKGQPPIL